MKMQKRKVITPAMRAQQTVLRRQSLILSEAYKAKLARDRTIAIRKAIKEMAKYPPNEWEGMAADHIIKEPKLKTTLTSLYLNVGTPVARVAVNRFLSRKADTSDMWEEALYEWTRKNMGAKINLMEAAVNDWLKGQVRNVIEDNPGVGIEKMTQIMQRSVSQNWNTIKEWQTRRIVQTETMSAMNVAASESIDLLGMDYERTWSIAGNNTRPTHEVMDGVTIPKGEYFNVGGYLMSHPMDDSMGAPAGEIINCSCCAIDMPKDSGMVM
jgi:hypothetical protein